MLLIEVVLLAIVQALTEFIPVSSSGHLLALQETFSIEGGLVLDVALHFGTLLALMVYFRKRLTQIAVDALSSRSYNLLVSLLLTTLPAAIAGYLLREVIDSIRTLHVVVGMLVLVGVLMVLVDRVERLPKVKHMPRLSYRYALLIGCAQAVALIPGTSRSGATMVMGRLLGLSRPLAAEYSFLAGIPIIFGATIKVLLEPEATSIMQQEGGAVLAGVLVSGVLGFAVLQWLIRFVGEHGLSIFGWYRLALAGFLAILFL